MRERLFLNEGWLYERTFSEAFAQKNYNSDNLEEIRIPHTNIETPFHYFDESIYQFVSGYRKVLFAPREWEGKSVILTFEGVAHQSTLYLNESEIYTHNCGYTAFSVDISDMLSFGEENLLAIKVDSRESINVPPFGYVIDYLTYGGVYRDVYIDVCDKTHFNNLYIAPVVDVKNRKATINTSFELSSKDIDGLTVSLSYKEAKDEEFIFVKSVDIKDMSESLREEEKVYEFACEISDEIKLWDTVNPNLYNIKATLIRNGEEIYSDTVRTGFRKIEFKADGFYLNEIKTKIRGLNRHQSFAYVGYAMPKSQQELDAKILKKELGVNAVRTSHYPQSHYFIDKCDELGLLVFTEIPGWQHIGNDEWKDQAVTNTRDMVLQYRNHTSIILWGVRINESMDDDEFYKRTNKVAHELDGYRQTGGVRCIKNSHLFEDVYTYNDFVHSGSNEGCEPKKNVTSDMSKGYLISEYNGHMFPTKNFDSEEHRREHALRHAKVLDSVASYDDIAGSFGWCMFDYNTHKDFGSGDRICYHGVTDMFRNLKNAGHIYSCLQDEEVDLSLSSSFDIGEHPACNRGKTWIYSNADSVRMYKNDRFIKEYTKEDSPYKNLSHGPILIDDFIGDAVIEGENFKPAQAKGVKDILNIYAVNAGKDLPLKLYLIALKLVLVYHMKPVEAMGLYNKYVGDWGGTSTVYKFEAIKDGKVVKTIIKEPTKKATLELSADHTKLVEENSYDVSLVRIKAVDQNGNLLPFFNEPIELKTEGSISLIGPEVVSLNGGMGGVYVKSNKLSGDGKLLVKNSQVGCFEVLFSVETK